MTELHKIGNISFKKAADEIILPTMNAGGNESSVMVVLESTIAAVLLTLNKGDSRRAAAMLEEGLVPRLIERLTLYAKDQS